MIPNISWPNPDSSHRRYLSFPQRVSKILHDDSKFIMKIIIRNFSRRIAETIWWIIISNINSVMPFASLSQLQKPPILCNIPPRTSESICRWPNTSLFHISSIKSLPIPIITSTEDNDRIAANHGKPIADDSQRRSSRTPNYINVRWCHPNHCPIRSSFPLD